MTSGVLTPLITTSHTTIPSPLPSAPSFLFHVTRLKDTLFVWVGTGAPTSAGAGAGGPGPSSVTGLNSAALDNDAEGVEALSGEKNVAREWGVSMPSRGTMPVTSTPIFRSGSSDLAVPMSQRLARKIPHTQIHLSLSLPPTLTSPSGPSLDPFASKTLLIMEKEMVKWLASVVAGDKA